MAEARYTVRYSRAAEKALLRLPTKMAERAYAAAEALAENPRAHGSIKLEGEENQYRLRVGNYRLIYSIEDEILLVLVLKVGHRKDVYR